MLTVVVWCSVVVTKTSNDETALKTSRARRKFEQMGHKWANQEKCESKCMIV
jgi:hypothetical protein